MGDQLSGLMQVRARKRGERCNLIFVGGVGGPVGDVVRDSRSMIEVGVVTVRSKKHSRRYETAEWKSQSVG